MIARYVAIAATLVLLACSGSDETLTDSAGSATGAAGAGIGTTDTTGLGASGELGAGTGSGTELAHGAGTQTDLEVNVGAVGKQLRAARSEVGEPGDELLRRRGGRLVEVERGHASSVTSGE